MSTSRGVDMGHEDHKAVVVRRPVPVEHNRLGVASRMASDDHHQQQGSHSVRRGVGRYPWMVGRPQGDSGSEDNVSTVTVDSSLKKEEGTTTSTWDRPALTNRSHDAALLRKAAFMYGSPLQALRATVAQANSDSAHPQSPVERSPGTSPSPFNNRMKVARRFENGMQSPQPQQQHVNVGAPAGIKQSGTAQLTIFYAGMVNVYDDVPSDKAQAIMLLAGTGNAWSSSNFNMVGGANRGSRPFVPPSGGMNQPMSRASVPAPQPSTPASPSGASAGVPDRQVPAAVELPQARKASLARFLEKRKDRVRKGPYSHPNDEAAKSDAMSGDGREASPSNVPESSGKPPLSPSRKESSNKCIAQSNNNINESETYGNESTSSHPPAPPRPRTSDSGKLPQFEIPPRGGQPVSPSR